MLGPCPCPCMCSCCVSKCCKYWIQFTLSSAASSCTVPLPMWAQCGGISHCYAGVNCTDAQWCAKCHLCFTMRTFCRCPLHAMLLRFAITVDSNLIIVCQGIWYHFQLSSSQQFPEFMLAARAHACCGADFSCVRGTEWYADQCLDFLNVYAEQLYAL